MGARSNIGIFGVPLEPTIETSRLILRPLTMGDADEVFSCRRDEQIMRYMGGPDRSIEDTHEALQRYERYQRMYGFSRWAMFLKETGDFIGDSGLLPMGDTPEFELGYRLAKSYWSRGLATECGEGWLDAAFTRFGLKSVIAFAHEDHSASIRVMQKLGMEFDKKAYIMGMDCCVYRKNRGIYPLESHL